MPPLEAIADVIGSVISAHGAHSANRAMINFQREVMSTKYQRQVQDLKAAGLNPMLAYMNPATAPPSPHLQNPNAAAEGIGSRALSAKLISAQTDKANAEAAYTRSQTPGTPGKIAAETEHSAAGAAAQRADVDRIAAGAANLRTESDLNKLRMQVMGLELAKLRAILPSLIEEARGMAARRGFGATALSGSEVLMGEWKGFLEDLAGRIRGGARQAKASGAERLRRFEQDADRSPAKSSRRIR